MTGKILITGATGFVGQALIKRLISDNLWDLRAALRSPNSSATSVNDVIYVTDLSGDVDWTEALYDVSVVVHLAARVHVMNEDADESFELFNKINVTGTLNLAKQSAAAGIKRFIFLSTIKVNGESTRTGMPFKADDNPCPTGNYAISKLKAEQGLMQIGSDTGMEIVIIRPPLVYGPGVKGNFLSLLKWVKKGWALPFGSVHNKRSLIFLDNLVDIIITCLQHPAAANQVFLVSDGEDLSTTELLKRISKETDSGSLLIPIPASIMTALAYVLGKKSAADRLLGSLQVDIAKTRDRLGWNPVVSVEEGLRQTVAGNLSRHE